MPEGQVLEFSGVTKRFGSVTAVSDLTARVEPGQVTGFLGPNGAGKTTTLRILLGLVRATEGTATIGGVPYDKLRRPLQSVGAVLEASSFHPGRTAANHLSVYAQAAGIARSRVDEVLGIVGLADAAGRKVGGFSLGMRQRLGLAYALLGDPGVLVLDEPSNGLDPEGIRWMRGLLRSLAAEGRTVLVSSHMLSEVQQTVDGLLIIARGQLVFQGGIEDLAEASDHATVVDAPDRAALEAALTSAGHSFEVLRNGLTVRTAEPLEVGALAASAGIALSSLQRRGATLEDVFLELVSGARVHASAGAVPDGEAAVPAADPASVTAAAPSSAPAALPGSGDMPESGESAAIDPDLGESPDLGAGDGPDADAVEPAGEPAIEPRPSAEPAAVTASFAVASTGVIDIVAPPSADDSDDAWLVDRIRVDRARDEGAPAAPDPDADPANVVTEPEPHDDPLVDPEHAPEVQPEQPSSLAWVPEPVDPDLVDRESNPDDSTPEDAPHTEEGNQR
jgi:ABC-2 type transport system ATP-binding protein